MFKSRKASLSSFNRTLCLLITAIFLIGLLPVPALAQANGTIAGQVTDNSTGNPIAGATICVLETEDTPPSWSSNTDASGNYTVSVPEGTGYLVGAIKEGYASRQVTGQSVTADVTTSINFSLLPGGVIQGIVTDNFSGSPIQGADVWAYQPGTPEVRYETLPAAADGSYSLGVPPGTGYTVQAAKSGYVDAIQTGNDAVLDSPATLNLALEPLDPPPASVTDLAAGSPTHNSITLTWTAPGNDRDSGTASQYDIRYDTSIIDDNSKFASAPQAPNIPTPNTAGTSENFTVSGLSANTTYFFALVAEDEVPNLSGLSNSPSGSTLPAPGFTITHSQDRSSFMLGAGDNITETFNISSVNNFAGTVNLNFNGPHEIEAGSSLSPTQVTLTVGQTQTVTLNLGASAMTPSGTYYCELGGQTTEYGGQQRGFYFTVIVGVSGEPLLSASPSVVAQGNQITFSVSQFVPSENVTLRWDSGPATGQQLGTTGTIDENGNWSLTVNVPNDAPGGNFVVRATSLSCTATVDFTVTSGSEADFLISASPQFISIEPGNSGNVTIYVQSINDFNAPVTLSTGYAPGVTCSLSAGSATPTAGETTSATLTITVADWASPNMFHINVEGACADPSITKMTDITLDIASSWGSSIALSQAYGSAGDSITISGSNFPAETQGQTVIIREVVTNTQLQTTPATITVNGGSFTGTFITPDLPSGSYQIEARVSTEDFAERNFQIMGTGDTFSLGVSPQSTTVTRHQSRSISLPSAATVLM